MTKTYSIENLKYPSRIESENVTILVHLRLNSKLIDTIENNTSLNNVTGNMFMNQSFGNFEMKSSFNNNIASYQKNKIDEILMENNLRAKKDDITEKHVEEIMKTFTDTLVWPQKTSLSCWWCRHGFNTVPVAIPCDYHDNKFVVDGCFCSFECALAHMYDENNYTWETIYLIKQMAKKMGIRLNIKKYAPSWKSLKAYGGSLSIEQFRSKVCTNLNTNVMSYPIISRKTIMEIHPNIKSTKSTKAKSKVIFNKKKKSTKKTKKKNALEKSMGIKFF